MGILSMFKRKRNNESRSGDSSLIYENDLFSNEQSVTVAKSLSISTVNACVNILSSAIASLPIITYQQTKDGRNRITNIPLANVLKIQANKNMTAYSFKELMMLELLFYGNSFWQKVFNNKGQVVALFHLSPTNIKLSILENGDINYIYTKDNSEVYVFSRDDIFHVKGMSLDGYIGYPPLKMYESQINGALVLQKFAQTFFENGANVGSILEHPSKLSDSAFKNLKESFTKEYTGIKSSNKPIILEEGMKFNKIALPNDQAQFLESRKFSVTEIARIFRVPLHLLAELDRATFNNIEQQSIDFVRNTLSSWFVRIEQEIIIQLLSTQDRANKITVEFLVDAMLRGDTKSRFEAYKLAIQNGWMSINEVRALENLNKIDGGDVYAFPLNMTTVENIAKGDSNV